MQYRSLKLCLHLFAQSLSSFSCKTPEKAPPTFTGKAQAIEKAEKMFEAIGGKKAWCDLRSLYIKAEQTEPQKTIPYQSEIWRGIERFELVIEQQNDSFHAKAIVSDEGGQVHYLDKWETFRTLSDSQLKNWEFDHNHHVYVLLHNLARTPQNYKVEIDEVEGLAFYQDSVFLCSFGLDDKMRSPLFYHPDAEGKVSGSLFTHWGEVDGLVHSAGGNPLDSNFVYRTEIWQPSKKPLKETFGDQLFERED